VSDYNRLTVQGTRNRADLVLPADEPLAALLPDILELLDEPPGAARPLTLVTVLGEQLNTSLSLGEQNLTQGSIVRLVRLDEAPPPPEVADITQLAGESVAARDDRWRRPWAVLVAAAATLVIGRLVGPQLILLGMERLWLMAAAAGLAAVAIALARRGARGAGVPVTALAIGLLGAPLEWMVAGQPFGAGWGAAFGGAAALVAVVAQLGYQDRGLALGGASAAALVALWAALGAAGLPPLHAAGLVALAGALGVGLLPGIAMAASGLTGLDDRVIEGELVARPAAAEAVDATHRGLSAACIGFGLVTAAAGFLLATSLDPWALGLGTAIVVVLLLRTRVLPLAPQRLALFGAALVIAGGLALTGLQLWPTWTLVALLALASLLVAAVGVRLSDNVLARLARFGNLLELLAVLASVPLLLGLMGLFSDLLAAF
jgi:type VII secretion integral membrane protein EccD